MCFGGRSAPASNAGYWSDAELWLNGTEAELVECNFRSIRDNCVGIDKATDPILGFSTLPPSEGGAESGAGAPRVGAGDSQGVPAEEASLSALQITKAAAGVCHLENPLYSQAYREETGCRAGYRGRLCAACLPAPCRAPPVANALCFLGAESGVNDTLDVADASWYQKPRCCPDVLQLEPPHTALEVLRHGG